MFSSILTLSDRSSAPGYVTHDPYSGLGAHLLKGRPSTTLGVTRRTQLAASVGNLIQGSSQAVSSADQRSVPALRPVVDQDHSPGT